MKKLVSVVAAFVLCLAMTATCFAASPVKATLKSGNVTLSEVSADVSQAIQTQTGTKEALKTVLGDKFTETAAVVSVFDLSGAGGEVEVEIAGIAAGDSVVVLHWVSGDMTKAPEVLSATAGAGTVKFTTGSCSPFAVVKLASAAATTPEAAASPKTSEAGAMAAVAVMLISAAGIAVLNRRKFA